MESPANLQRKRVLREESEMTESECEQRKRKRRRQRRQRRDVKALLRRNDATAETTACFERFLVLLLVVLLVLLMLQLDKARRDDTRPDSLGDVTYVVLNALLNISALGH